MNNTHDDNIRGALEAAIHGHPAPSVFSDEAISLIAAVRERMETPESPSFARLGVFAMKLLVDRHMSSALAEREAAIQLDRIRKA